MRHKLLIIIVFIVFLEALQAQDQITYIRQYQDIAVAEMLRSGIPASIKLAQAILESNCGQSELACKANNHFGIKCGGSWNGKSFHKEDDDYANGQLVKSCFREFNSVMESYKAHSDFLADPAKAARYGSLFLLEPTDYKGWAKGLSKSGYATDPQYADRLISIIEKFELYRFDNEYEHELASASPPASTGRQLVRSVNDVTYTMALKGDNADILARRNNLSVSKVMRYNEDISGKEQELATGSRVYLQPKKSSYNGKQKYHLLKEGEDLADVSSQYGIKLESLAKRNGLEKNEVPLPNQKIMLKGRSKKELRTANPYEIPGAKKSSSPKSTPSRSTVPGAPDNDEVVASTGNSPGAVSRPSSVKESTNAMHTVVKGDTLYGIARNYGMTVDDLKKKNNIMVDTIYVGQKLVWK